jgi:hypothetical protein
MKGSYLEGETGEEGRGKQTLPGKCDYFRLAPAMKRSFGDFVGTDGLELPARRVGQKWPGLAKDCFYSL